MEDRHPIKLEEIPETGKPKHGIVYTIAIVCLTALLYFIAGLIKNPKALNSTRSKICVYKASRILKKTEFVDSINVYPMLNRQVMPLLNKAILLDKSNWNAWAMKGGIYTRQWMHLDNAAMCLHKAIRLQEKQGAPDEAREATYDLLVVCLWRAHLHREALAVAMEGANKFPTNQELKKDVMRAVGQYYRDVLDTGETILDEKMHVHVHKIVLFADTLCQNNFWEDAIWVIRTTRDKYPDNEDLKTALQEIGAVYADRLLADSEDTKAMWYLSKAIESVDRKRALNLRRKCARLGNKDAQDWLKKKGYEWD